MIHHPPFQFPSTRDTEVFGCRFDIHETWRHPSSRIARESFERMFLQSLKYPFEEMLNERIRRWISFSRKVSNRVSLFSYSIEIEKFLDPIYRGKIGIGSVGKSAATRYARGNLALPWPDRGRLRLVAFPGKHGRTAYPCALHLDVLIFALIWSLPFTTRITFYVFTSNRSTGINRLCADEIRPSQFLSWNSSSNEGEFLFRWKDRWSNFFFHGDKFLELSKLVVDFCAYKEYIYFRLIRFLFHKNWRENTWKNTSFCSLGLWSVIFSLLSFGLLKVPFLLCS